VLGRRKLVIAGAAAIAIIAGAVAAVYALRSPPLDDSVVPVVLVHGYGGDADSMRALRGVLQDAGHTAVAVPLPARGTGDLLDSARVLAAAVEASGAAKIDLVGYSAGGIVIRAYLKHVGGVERARRVVLIATPNHGAQAATLAAVADPASCVDACQQLASGSDFLSDLNDGDESPEGVQFITIWTGNDRVVTPASSAQLDGAVNIRLQDVCSDAIVEHEELVHYPLPVALVLRALGPGLSKPPAPSECAALRARGEAALSPPSGP